MSLDVLIADSGTPPGGGADKPGFMRPAGLASIPVNFVAGIFAWRTRYPGRLRIIWLLSIVTLALCVVAVAAIAAEPIID